MYYEDPITLRQDIENDLMEQIPVLSKMPSEITSDEQFVAILESFFTYIKDNDRMFRILILQSDKRAFNRRLIDAVLRKYHVESQSSNPRLAKYEYVFIVSGVIGLLGASGAGKTTLLNLLGGMDAVTDGKIVLDGNNIAAYGKRDLTLYRRRDVGFVFQFYNLMPNLTALENVEIAVEICENHLDPKNVLESVGLADRLNNFPAELSGGEQQRVSIARAVAKNPKLILCDEPTGALDYVTGKKILKLLYTLSREQGKLVIVVTHNAALKDMADKVIRIKSGRIERVEVNANPIPVEAIEW